MLTTEQAPLSSRLLAGADEMFALGNLTDGSQLMWDAARHAVIAVAKRRGWPCDTHEDLANAIMCLDEQNGDSDSIYHSLYHKFGFAEIFKRNVEYDTIQSYEIDVLRRPVAALITDLESRVE